jgi:hypothetical protein
LEIVWSVILYRSPGLAAVAAPGTGESKPPPVVGVGLVGGTGRLPKEGAGGSVYLAKNRTSFWYLLLSSAEIWKRLSTRPISFTNSAWAITLSFSAMEKLVITLSGTKFFKARAVWSVNLYRSDFFSGRPVGGEPKLGFAGSGTGTEGTTVTIGTVGVEDAFEVAGGGIVTAGLGGGVSGVDVALELLPASCWVGVSAGLVSPAGHRSFTPATPARRLNTADAAIVTCFFARSLPRRE